MSQSKSYNACHIFIFASLGFIIDRCCCAGVRIDVPKENTGKNVCQSVGAKTEEHATPPRASATVLQAGL
jgi:hypothetical protein